MNGPAMSTRAPHHVALRSRDPARLAAFYQRIFSLSERSRAHAPDGSLRSVWLALGPHAVLMVERAGPDEPAVPPGSMELFALAVTPAERDALLDVLAAEGVALEARTEHTLYFRDPEGRRVGASSYPL